MKRKLLVGGVGFNFEEKILNLSGSYKYDFKANIYILYLIYTPYRFY